MSKRKDKLPEVQAAPMADIAFLLLIFFLVVATFDTDTGIMRKLPPMPRGDVKESDATKVKERNVFIVLVNKDDELLVENEYADLRDLRRKAKEFIANPFNRADLPAKKMIEVPYFGLYPVTVNHVISLRNDRGTSYNMYIAVQNELAAAYTELRDELALQQWGQKYSNLEEDKQEAINKIYKNSISEAEPKNIGGM
jgi:biopolymer transport protein ExbD